MADLTVAAVVERLEDAISGLSGWVLSPVPADFIGDNTRPLSDRVGSVMARTTTVRQGGEPRGRRQSIAEGAYVDTVCEIAWLATLRVNDYSDSIREAYADEATLLAAVYGTSRESLHVTVDTLDRSLAENRAVLRGTISLTCTHSLALA